MARLLLAHGADPNASVFTAGSATAAAYTGGSPRSHAPDQAMMAIGITTTRRVRRSKATKKLDGEQDMLTADRS